MTQLWRARVDDCGESESRRRSESDFEIQKKTGANQTRSYFELCIDLCGGLMFPFFLERFVYVVYFPLFLQLFEWRFIYCF